MFMVIPCRRTSGVAIIEKAVSHAGVYTGFIMSGTELVLDATQRLTGDKGNDLASGEGKCCHNS
jgi:hypothetical protein